MLEIRQATTKDAQAVLDFCKLVGGESDNLTYDGKGLPFTPEEEAAYLASMEASDHNFFLIAWEQGQIVGTCSYSGYANERLAHRGELGIAVRKSMWGRQVGSRLMEEIIGLARNNAHAEILSLEVRSDNLRAIALYQKYGFEKIGQFKGYLKINGELVDFDLMNLYL